MTTTTIQLQGAMIANPPLTTLWDGGQRERVKHVGLATTSI
jgi:hypothetical protein